MHNAQEHDRGASDNKSLSFQLTQRGKAVLQREDDKYIEDLNSLQTHVFQ